MLKAVCAMRLRRAVLCVRLSRCCTGAAGATSWQTYTKSTQCSDVGQTAVRSGAEDCAADAFCVGGAAPVHYCAPGEYDHDGDASTACQPCAEGEDCAGGRVTSVKADGVVDASSCDGSGLCAKAVRTACAREDASSAGVSQQCFTMVFARNSGSTPLEGWLQRVCDRCEPAFASAGTVCQKCVEALVTVLSRCEVAVAISVGKPPSPSGVAATAACTLRASTRSRWPTSKLTEKLCGEGNFKIRGAETMVWAPDRTCAQWRDFIQHTQWGKQAGEGMMKFVRPVVDPGASRLSGCQPSAYPRLDSCRPARAWSERRMRAVLGMNEPFIAPADVMLLMPWRRVTRPPPSALCPEHITLHSQ